MSMADFASALQGGGGPPPAAPSPDAGAAPPPDTGGPGGLPPDLAAAPPPAPVDTTQSQYTTSLDALDGAEQALHTFIQMDPDENDRAEATKALQVVIKLKASNQDSANAGDLTSLQRALQGPGATAGAVGAAVAPPAPGGGY
jgi:hypothetical protein